MMVYMVYGKNKFTGNYRIIIPSYGSVLLLVLFLNDLRLVWEIGLEIQRNE